MSRAEWFCHFLFQFPTPSCITSLTRDVFVKQSWDVVDRKKYKQQFLEHLYNVAVDSITLPLSEDSLAVITFRLQLHRYVGLSAQRLQLEKQSENYLQERSDYRHLRTIPGIGAVIALMIIA